MRERRVRFRGAQRYASVRSKERVREREVKVKGE